MNITDITCGQRNDACSPTAPSLAWYALRTRSNHEKIAAAFLEAKGFEQFLPLYRAPKRWSDRVVENWLPLFPGYLFCRFDGRHRTPIMSALGVVSIVAFGSRLAPIDDMEIEAIRRALGSGQATEPYPYLQEGQKIQIKKGPLRGLEGVLVKKRSWRLVISVELLRRSVAVDIDPDSVDPLSFHKALSLWSDSAGCGAGRTPSSLPGSIHLAGGQAARGHPM